MKRFEITNLVNGMKFVVERETLEPLQPEWGLVARQEVVVDENGVETVVDFPAEFEVVETDVTEELAQTETTRAALEFLVECDWKRNRHISQKAIGIETSLSDEEYSAMETAAQAARDSIVK